MTEEELQTLRLMMREEIATAVSASEQRVQTIMREEIATAVSASEKRIQRAMHEEITTAILAGEQRTGERLDRLEGRVARMDGRMDQLDKTQRDLYSEMVRFKSGLHSEFSNFRDGISEEIKHFKTDVRKDLALSRTEVRGDLALFKVEVQKDLTLFKTGIQKEQNEIISMLNDITTVVSNTQADQRNLENKLDSNHLALKRSMQDLELKVQDLKDTTQRLAVDFIEMNRLTNERLTYHEQTPLGETHPRFQQPGTAA